MVAGDAGALKELFEAATGAGVRARMVPVDYASHTVHVEAIEGELAEVLAGLVPRVPEIPMYSTFRDAWLDGSTVLDASYWYGNLRHEVRFASAVEALAGAGYRAFVEVSAHPVLTTAVQDLLDAHADSPAVTTGTLRRDEDTSARFHMSLATLHTRGIATDPLPDVTGHHHVDLPTYPFQHQSYWLQIPESAGDLGTAGLDDAGHPLLGAVVRLPEDGGVLLTGRLSLASHPWLADHAVSGTVLVPGAALVELAVHAGQQVDAGVLDELVVETPLVLPATGAVRVQVTAGATDDLGRRAVAVHARGEDGEAWTRHASGFLTTGVAGHGTGSAADGFDFGVWPPEGAEALSVADFYDLRFVAGYEYGPVFQGLRRVWRRGEELFADVVLGEEAAGDAGAFGLHPALLDAALHTAAFADGPQDERTLLPFAWNGVAVHATGVSALRVRIAPRGADAVSVQAADGAGSPVASVGSLAFRAVDPRQLESGDDVLRDALFRVDWQEVPAPETSAGADWPVLDLTGRSGADVRELSGEALAAVQAYLARDAEGSRLVVLTRDALADPAQAAVWGLVRTAQNEHPDRLVLVDVADGSESLLPAALATGEPQLALAGDAIRVPRLVRAEAAEATGASPLDPDGTVLITGGTGTLGALAARHVVTAHGVRRLLLLSRRGPDAPGAGDLTRELSELGAHVTVVAADAADRDQLAAALAGIDPDHPLTAVIHTAGALSDATFTAQTAQHLDAVFAPKTDAARALYELTKDQDLAAFVLYSSAAGTLGNPGQANYAAANAALDAYAHALRADGYPAVSLAWGLWADASGMTGHLDGGDQDRMSRQGALALSAEEGMALFDAALRSSEAVRVASRMNFPALRAAAAERRLPVVFRALVSPPRKAAHGAHADGASLAGELAGLPEADRRRRVLELVRTHASTVLGGQPVRPEQPFKEVGFDSLTAVELRNRLATATGVRLPATLIFDYPAPAALARHLLAELLPDTAPEQETPAEPAAPAAAVAVEAELHRIAAMDADDLVARALGALGA
ncbi:SDR family NAD(P)-dependent oxidoreductase [Streptomyces sp. NPDC004684]